jgi:hypothetical protein
MLAHRETITRALRAGRAVLIGAVALAGTTCTRPAERSTGGSASGTVFTDSALFRQTCLEADSGLTMAAQRCTPRDQGAYPPSREREQPLPPSAPR